jgi:hypothetical protein
VIVNDIRNRQKVFQRPLRAYEIVAILQSPRCNIQKKLAKLELILGETEHAFVAPYYPTSKIPTSFLPRIAIMSVSNSARHLSLAKRLKSRSQWLSPQVPKRMKPNKWSNLAVESPTRDKLSIPSWIR